MIYKTLDIEKSVLEKLKNNNYARRIKSHLLAYGTGYDFARFFVVENNDSVLGLICVFNSTMMISTLECRRFGDDVLAEIAGFISMERPASVEFECEYAQKLSELLKDEYRGDTRTEFAFEPKNELPVLQVDELPKLDKVFDILKTCFPALADSYELWLADTSHRVRRGLSQSFLLGDYTTATIQYIIDGVALVGHVGTVPEERGKFHARQLLYWIGEKLTGDGFQVRLFARPHRVSYYNEIGFRECGVDMVLERINLDE